MPFHLLFSSEIAEELHRNLSKNPTLFCRLSDRNRHPLLILSPLKEEILSHSPPIFFFHDIIHQDEMELMKEKSREKFSSAQILNHEQHKTKVEKETRRAEVAWQERHHWPRLTERLAPITGLNPFNGDGAETYQDSRYDVGGHYIAHYDMLFEIATDEQGGDRIATL